MRELGAVLAAWEFGEEARATALDSGLINQSFRVEGASGTLAVVQRLNTDIFRPCVHEDIEAVTGHLARRGIPTPRLVRTRAGGLWHTDAEGQVWRALSPVGERTLERVEGPAQAASAASLVARVHDALEDLEWTFQSVRQGAQDTERHLANLRSALDEFPRHAAASEVAALSAELHRLWEEWPDSPALPTRVIHGDLKISNIRFVGDEAYALIDLDTFAWSTLEVELGDALRSWCNPCAEDDSAARFDGDLALTALRAYEASSATLQAGELKAVVYGVGRITLNLVARFAADALQERYFGWNAARYPSRGLHNLARARGQHALLLSILESQPLLLGAIG